MQSLFHTGSSPRKGNNQPRRRSKTSSSSSSGSDSASSAFKASSLLELSPEKTLVEFISTSAAYFKVKRKPLNALEDEITRVSPNNIMPANAAAWYLAKRKYYLRNPPEYQLLPFLLRNHPDKFNVKGSVVEFKEMYDKEVAQKKLRDLNRLGLVAYFTHKVDEYGVYLFDPLYYEKTEPFYSGLKAATKRNKSHRSDLLPAFFEGLPGLHLSKLNPYLLALSSGSEPVEVRTNTVGVVVKMLDKEHGVLQFGTEDGTAKAIFSTRALFREGFQFRQGDPMQLPAMEFDGYRLPRRVSGGGSGDGFVSNVEYSWAAVLVWCGKKPSPKYNATKADLMVEGAFGSVPAPQGVFDELLMKGKSGIPNIDDGRGAAKSNVFNPLANATNGGGVVGSAAVASNCMQIGQIVKIRKDGAFVALTKDKTGDKAFLPGWMSKSNNGRGSAPTTILTTPNGVAVHVGDLVGYYIHPTQAAPKGAVARGFNTIVLKKAADMAKLIGKGGDNVAVNVNNNNVKKGRKSRSNSENGVDSDGNKGGSSSDERGNAKRKGRKTRTKSTTSETAGEETEKTEKEKAPSAPRVKQYLRYLLVDDLSDNEGSIHSDADPPFDGIIPDSDYDFDEYSDGEILDEEIKDVEKESVAEINVEEMKKLIEEAEVKRLEAEREAKVKAAQEAKEAREKAVREAKEAKIAERTKRMEERKAEKERKQAEKAAKLAEKEAANADSAAAPAAATEEKEAKAEDDKAEAPTAEDGGKKQETAMGSETIEGPVTDKE